MAIIKDGQASAGLWRIEPTLDQGLVSVVPWEDGVSGAYMARWTTGVLAAALAVDAPVAGIRNGPTANTKNVYIQEIGVSFAAVVAFTATQQFGLYLDRYSAANLASGTAYTPMKMKDNYPNSACLTGAAEAGDIRASGTTLLTSAGVTFQGFKVPILGWSTKLIDSQVGPAIIDFAGAQSQPLRLAPGEGVALRNLVAWPAAGTGVVSGYIKWLERTT
jgi:hypothetical protein